MRKLLVLCCFAVLFVQNVFSQNLGDVYDVPEAGFSMYIPKGWRMADMNQKYLSAIGPSDGGFTPNINFGTEEYSGPIPEYFDAVIGYLENFYADFEVLNRTDFTANSGLQGMYITIQGRINEIRVRQRIYVFPNKKKTDLMLVTSTAPLVGGERYDALFDECVKTLKWTKQ